MKTHLRFARILSAGLLCLSALPAFGSTAAGITYMGRLLDSSGTPVTSNTVQFRLQIRTPTPTNCLMYEETKTIDMSSSAGTFSLTLNDGNGTRTDAGTYTLQKIFANTASFTFAPSDCGGTNVYTPGSTDGRQMSVAFNDGSFGGWETLPTVAINYVPMSIESYQVGGFTASSLLRVADASGNPQSASALTPANFSDLLDLINGTSTKYLPSSTAGAALPVFSSAPSGITAGDVWFDSGTHTVKYFDGTTTQTVGTSGGSVTSVATGAGLTGGPITTTGTISLATVGSGGSGATKINYDTYGRVIGSAALAEADLPTITTAGKVSGDAITSGTIAGNTAISTTGNVASNSSSTRSLTVYQSVPANSTIGVTLGASNSQVANYTLTLPASAGSNGQVLTTDGSGTLTWSSPSAGSVTSVTGTAPIVSSGGSSPTISIAQATTSTNGYLSSTDWNTFNGKLGSASVFAGDVSGTSTTTSVDRLKGTGLTITTLTAGNFLKYNGSAWVNATPSSADLSDAGSLLKSSQMPANCSAGQTLTFSSPTGTWACSTIAVTASNFSSQSANTVLAAPNGTTGAPTFRTLASADLPTAGTAGTYGSATNVPVITTDAYGRVTSVTNTPITTSATGLTGIVPVANGGTGVSSITSGALVVGAGTSATTTLAAGATGNVVYGTSATAFASGSPDIAGLVDKSSAQTITGAKTFTSVSATSLKVTGGTPAAGKVLTSDASGNATWTTPATGVSGSGTANYVAKFTGSTAVGSSILYDDGTNVGIGTSSTSSYKLNVNGNSMLGNPTGTTYNATPALSVVGAISSVAQPVNMNVYDTTAMATGVGGGIGLMGNDGATDRTFALVHGGKENGTSGNYAGYFSVWTRPNGGSVTERVRVDSGGKVGINTTSPGTLLEVNGSSVAAPNAILRVNATAGDQTNGPYSLVLGDDTQDSAKYRGFRLGLTSQGDGFLYSYVAGVSKNLILNYAGGNVGIGSSSPAYTLDVNGTARATQLCIGTDCRSAWPGSGGGGTVTSVTSANSDISVATTTSTPVLTLNTGTTANQIVKLDASAKLPAVDGSALTNVNATKLAGTAVTITTLTSGNYLKYNGTAWVNVTPSSADLSDTGSLIKSSQMPANCSAGQTLTFSSPTGTWTCTNITVTASNFGSQSANTVLAAPSGTAGVPTFRTLASADLPTAGTAGTYGSATQVPVFTTDAYGRVTSVTNTTITTSATGLTGIVPVANGGTGLSSITAGALMVGAGTSAATTLAAGAAGNVIYGTSATAFSVGTPDTAGLVDKASAQTIAGTKTFTQLNTASLKVTGGTPAAGKVLTSDASGNATWATATGGVSGSGTANYLPKFTGASALGNSVISNSGTNVGIGTATPGDTLSIESPQDTYIKFSQAGTYYASFGRADSGGALLDLGIGGVSNAVHFDSRNGYANYINNGGNVGIGTSTANTKLEVAGGIRAGGETVVTACGASTEGVQRYNYTNHAVEWCNGTTWVSATSVAGTTPTPTGMGGTGYFVLSNSTWNGNLGGLAGANAKCRTELSTYNWKGKPGSLDTSKVFAFMCDGSACNNPIANTNYYYATANDTTAGGAFFVTNSDTTGPNDNYQWNAANRFNAAAAFWSSRYYHDPNTWAEYGNTSGPGSGNCSNWTSSASVGDYSHGSTGGMGTDRWDNQPHTCDETLHLICYVNP